MFLKNQRNQMVNQQNQMLRAGQPNSQMNSGKSMGPGVTANNGVNSNMQRNPSVGGAVNAMNKPAMRQMANSGAASPANRMSTQSPVNTSKGKSRILIYWACFENRKFLKCNEDISLNICRWLLQGINFKGLNTSLSNESSNKPKVLSPLVLPNFT